MSILIDAGVVIAGAAVLLCLARIIQKWSWAKMLMIMCSILIAVFFGDYVTIETVQSAWPKFLDFLNGFGIRIAVIVVLIFCAIQIAGLIRIFFRSRAWKSAMHGVRIILNIIANVHPWFATIVSGMLWFVSCVKIALSRFYAIDDEDGVDDAVVKVRNLHLMSLFYDIVDYWAAAYCALLVSYMAAYQWSFVAKMIGVWLLVDIPFAMGALYGCFKTGKDLTWGEAHRRAHDGVYTHNRIAGWIYRIVQHVFGIIWDGPEQLAIFYRSELMTRSRMYVVVLFLSTFQAIFWAWAYSLANDAFIIRALEWLD